MKASCSSTLYYYLVYKEAASGKSHGRSQAVTSSISPESCWRFIAEVHTLHLLWICPGSRWEVPLATTALAKHPASRGNQQQRRQSKKKCSLPGEGNISVLRTAPAWGQREPTLTSVSSKIQLRVNRDVHFAPTQKQLLQSWPCYRLLHALPVLAWLSEAGSSTHWSVLKWARCKGRDPRKLG